jgi:hypothetical protein
MVDPQDWPVVTVDGLLLLLLDDPELEVVPELLLDEELELSSDDVDWSSDEVVDPSDELESSPKMPDWSEPVESDDVPLVPDEVPDEEETDAVVWVADEVVPIGPFTAITPNASANVARDAAMTRLRIRVIRAARARSLAWASSLGERVGSELDRSAVGRSEGDGSDMESTVGTGSESTLGAAWEIPEWPCGLSDTAQCGLRLLTGTAPTMSPGKPRLPPVPSEGVP